MPTTIYRESSTQETLRELINLQAKQAEISLLLVEQQKRNGLPAKEPLVSFREMLSTTRHLQLPLTRSSLETSNRTEIVYISSTNTL